LVEEDELLLYRLNADSGESWLYDPRPGGLFAWVAQVESSFVFGEESVIKIFRYGPDTLNPGWYYNEHHLAFGFGLTYEWLEPGNVTYLTGCVINGDTFGYITNVTPSSLGPVPTNIEISRHIRILSTPGLRSTCDCPLI
jgi:hypothetical protein